MNHLSLFAAALTAIALGTSVSGAPVAPHRNDSASEKLGIKVSLQCYTYRNLSFYETVDKAASMGIRYLEAYPGQKLRPDSNENFSHNMSPETCDAILQKLKSAGGLKLVAYGVDGIPDNEAEARKEFDWARKMGIQVLVTETMPAPMHDKLCAEYNIRMALHNHPSSWPPEDVLKAVKDRDARIGSCSDTGHWMRRGLDPLKTLHEMAGRVEHLHFKDLNDGNHDVPWGTGKGQCADLLAELKRQGYKGYCSIEYEEGNVAELDANLPLCIQFFDKTMTQLAAKPRK